MYRVDLSREDAFDEFRDAARALIGANVSPDDVTWNVGPRDLLAAALPQGGASFSVPAAYLPLARAVVRHRDEERFALLYQLLWRITHGERELLSLASDPLMRRLRDMADAMQQDTATLSSLPDIRMAAAQCQRCPLFRDATQTVFGEGPPDASVVFVGEQPGDQEDLAGRPFVGPAGQMFDRALAEAGIDRSRVYVTNAVKHFKFEPRGKRRIHKKPDGNEIEACRWWLDNELRLLKPRLTVALGATAARALTGQDMTISRSRGRLMRLRDGVEGFITVHPSFLLRLPDAASKRREYERFVLDLKLVAKHLPEIRKAA